MGKLGSACRKDQTVGVAVRPENDSGSSIAIFRQRSVVLFTRRYSIAATMTHCQSMSYLAPHGRCAPVLVFSPHISAACTAPRRHFLSSSPATVEPRQPEATRTAATARLGTLRALRTPSRARPAHLGASLQTQAVGRVARTLETKYEDGPGGRELPPKHRRAHHDEVWQALDVYPCVCSQARAGTASHRCQVRHPFERFQKRCDLLACQAHSLAHLLGC